MHMSPHEGMPIVGPDGRQNWVDAGRYTIVQRFFLARIERLVSLRKSKSDELESWQNALLNRAIYSTYRDCVDLGLNDEARAILRGTGDREPGPTGTPGPTASK